MPYTDTPPGEEFLFLKDVFEDAVAIRMNLGCPFRCDYCASHKLNGTFCTGDPGLTFNLVKELNKLYGIRNFAFLDDALLVKKREGILPFLNYVIDSETRSFNL